MHDVLCQLERLEQDDLDAFRDAVAWIESLDEENMVICLHTNGRFLANDETLLVRVQVRQLRHLRLAALLLL